MGDRENAGAPAGVYGGGRARARGDAIWRRYNGKMLLLHVAASYSAATAALPLPRTAIFLCCIRASRSQRGKKRRCNIANKFWIASVRARPLSPFSLPLSPLPPLSLSVPTSFPANMAAQNSYTCSHFQQV